VPIIVNDPGIGIEEGGKLGQPQDKPVDCSQIKAMVRANEVRRSRHNACRKCSSKVMAAEVMQAEDQGQGAKNTITNKAPMEPFKWLNLKEQILHLI